MQKSNKESYQVQVLFYIILTISIIIIFWDFIFGKGIYIYTDIGSDTFHSYYPFYVNCAIRLREGNMVSWLWNEGLGNSILNYVYILDPFSWITILCGALVGPQIIQYLLVWTQIAKIIIVYVLSSKYLRFFCKSEVAICLGAYLSALNGYLFLWGQHYFFGTGCIWILAMLIIIEKYIANDTKRWGIRLALIVTCVILSNYYLAYMILVVSGTYFLYRFLWINREKVWTEKLQKIGKTFLLVLTGVFLSGVELVPVAYYTITNSSRLDAATDSIGSRLWHTFISSFNVREVIERMCFFMSNNMRYINDTYNSYYPNYYTAPQFFITIFIFFFSIQWLIWEEKRAKTEGTLKWFFIKCILLYLAIFNSMAGLITNMFVGVVYRYTFTVIPILSLGVALVWENIIENKKVSFIGVIVGGVLSGVTCLYAFFNSSSEVHWYVILTTIILAIGGGILFLYSLRWIKSKRSIVIFLGLIIISTVLDDYITTNQRTYVVSENAINWENGKVSNSTIEALEWISKNDSTFYRIEKNYEDWHQVSDSRFEGYSTLTAYNSTLNRNVVSFINNLYYDNIPGDIYSVFVVPHWNAVLEEQVLSIINTKYILSKTEMDEYDWCELIKVIDDIYIYRNIKTESMAKWYTRTISKEEFESLDSESKANVLQDNLIINDYDINLENSEAQIGDFVVQDDAKISGTINCDGNGILMLAIPDQEGWHIYLDGEEQQTYNSNYGFIGIGVSEGEHLVEAEYTIPKLKEGLSVSLVGIVFLILFMLSTLKIYYDKRNESL